MSGSSRYSHRANFCCIRPLALKKKKQRNEIVKIAENVICTSPVKYSEPTLTSAEPQNRQDAQLLHCRTTAVYYTRVFPSFPIYLFTFVSWLSFMAVWGDFAWQLCRTLLSWVRFCFRFCCYFIFFFREAIYIPFWVSSVLDKATSSTKTASAYRLR